MGLPACCSPSGISLLDGVGFCALEGVIPCQDRYQGNGCQRAPCDRVREPCHLQITSAGQALSIGDAGWSGLLTAAAGVQGILGGIVERHGPQDRALGQPAPQVGPLLEERLRAFIAGPTVGIYGQTSERSERAATLVRTRLSQAESPYFASFEDLRLFLRCSLLRSLSFPCRTLCFLANIQIL